MGGILTSVRAVQIPSLEEPVVFYEVDFEEEVIRPGSILFWGTVGPMTATAVVVADRAQDLLAWLRERARVEGRASRLAHALAAVEVAARRAGDDGELAADAIFAALEEQGIPCECCGPLARELAGNEALRHRVWPEGPEDEPVPESVLRGGEAHVEVEGAAVSLPEGDDDEPEKGYRMDEEVEELAEAETIDWERPDHREDLAARLGELGSSRRRAA
jgi:hypothetical protein